LDFSDILAPALWPVSISFHHEIKLTIVFISLATLAQAGSSAKYDAQARFRLESPPGSWRLQAESPPDTPRKEDIPAQWARERNRSESARRACPIPRPRQTVPQTAA